MIVLVKIHCLYHLDIMSSKPFINSSGVDNFKYLSEFADQLNPKKIYYDFYINELVGYIPSAFFTDEFKDGEISVTKDFEDAAVLMMVQSFQEFEALEVNLIESDLEYNFSKFNQVLNKHGYKLLDMEKMVARLPLPEIRIPKHQKYSFEQIKEYKIRINSENEIIIPELVVFLLEHENISEKSLNTFFTYLYTSENILLNQITVSYQNNLVGHGLLVTTRWDKKTGLLSFVHTEGKEPKLIQHLMMTRLLETAAKSKLRSIEVHIRDDVYDLSKNYEQYGFTFSPISTFSKT